MEQNNRPPMSQEEFVARMRDAGYEDWEIEEEIEERMFADKKQADNTAARKKEFETSIPPRHVEVVSDTKDADDHNIRSIEVHYGMTQIPIHIELPSYTGFDPKNLDYETLVLAAFKQCHGKNYDAIHVRLNEASQVTEAGVSVDANPQPFERIRRITGYLVGNMDRFNDAKAAEVKDRVKHGTTLGNEAHDALQASVELSRMDAAAGQKELTR